MSTTLLDIMKDLTYGEFAQLAIGNMIPGETESEPDPENYEKLIRHINMGLTEIYKRFFLLSREVDIQQHEEISTYLLHSKYSVTVGTEPTLYVRDTIDEPFLDDILKIEEVYDEGGDKYFLNDVSEDLSLYTPSYRSIQVPYPDDDVTMSVQYRANHPKIIYAANMEPEDIDVSVPNSLYEALLYYVASRVFASLGGDGGVESNDYFQRFENSCRKVDELGLEVQAEPGDWRFDTHGWV